MPVGRAAAVTDTAGGASFHPFTMPSSPGCVAWSDPAEGTTYNCDPVNVVFPGRTWIETRDLLVAQGWTTSGFGSSQSLHFGNASLVSQHEHVFWPESSSSRYHARLWQAAGAGHPGRGSPRAGRHPAHDRHGLGRRGGVHAQPALPLVLDSAAPTAAADARRRDVASAASTTAVTSSAAAKPAGTSTESTLATTRTSKPARPAPSESTSTAGQPYPSASSARFDAGDRANCTSSSRGDHLR